MNWRLVVLALAVAFTAASGCSSLPVLQGEPIDGDGGAAGTSTSSEPFTTRTSTSSTSSTVPDPPEPSCYREDQALRAPGALAETGLLACSTVQIDDFYAACLNGGDCDAFENEAANEGCIGCLLASQAGGHYPPLLAGIDRGDGAMLYINVYACESMARGMAECAAPTSQYEHCGVTACETCASAQQEEMCLAEAEASFGICTTAIDFPPSCQPILDVDLMNLSPECAGADFETRFTSVANYICGAG